MSEALTPSSALSVVPSQDDFYYTASGSKQRNKSKNRNSVSCQACGQVFEGTNPRSVLNTHTKFSCPKAANRISWQCDACSKKFKDEHSFKDHCSKCVAKVRAIANEKIELAYARTRLMEAALQEHNLAELIPAEGELPEDIPDHMAAFIPPPPSKIRCDYPDCEYLAANQRTLKKHKKTAHVMSGEEIANSAKYTSNANISRQREKQSEFAERLDEYFSQNPAEAVDSAELDPNETEIDLMDEAALIAIYKPEQHQYEQEKKEQLRKFSRDKCPSGAFAGLRYLANTDAAFWDLFRASVQEKYVPGQLLIDEHATCDVDDGISAAERQQSIVYSGANPYHDEFLDIDVADEWPALMRILVEEFSLIRSQRGMVGTHPSDIGKPSLREPPPEISDEEFEQIQARLFLPRGQYNLQPEEQEEVDDIEPEGEEEAEEKASGDLDDEADEVVKDSGEEAPGNNEARSNTNTTKRKRKPTVGYNSSDEDDEDGFAFEEEGDIATHELLLALDEESEQLSGRPAWVRTGETQRTDARYKISRTVPSEGYTTSSAHEGTGDAVTTLVDEEKTEENNADIHEDAQEGSASSAGSVLVPDTPPSSEKKQWLSLSMSDISASDIEGNENEMNPEKVFASDSSEDEFENMDVLLEEMLRPEISGPPMQHCVPVVQLSVPYEFNTSQREEGGGKK